MRTRETNAGDVLWKVQSMFIAPTAVRVPRPPGRIAPPSAPKKAEAATASVEVLELGGFHGYLEPYVDPAARAPRAPTPNGAQGMHDELGRRNLIGGAAALATLIRLQRARTGQALVLSGGDFFQGPPLATFFKGKPVIEFMNAAGFDCMTLGNHDFELGVDELAARLREAHFPALAANLMDAASGRPVWQSDNVLNSVRPYHVANVNGARVAVVGLMKSETPSLTAPQNVRGLAWKSIEQTLHDVLPELVRKERPDVIVLHCQQIQFSEEILSQAQDALRKAAIEHPPALMFVGGHNDPRHNRPMLTPDGLIVQGTDRGEALNATGITVDLKRHAITKVSHENIPVIDARIAPDPAVGAIVDRYKRRMGQRFSERVGEAAIDLSRRRHVDGPVGNLVTGAMKEAMKADVAFLSSGSLKSDIAAGPITVGTIYEVDPFENRCVLLEMSGRQLADVLQKSASRPSGDKVLQVSGATMVYDSSRPPGQRLVSCTLGGAPIQPDRIYRVAVDDFLANGGDFYREFTVGRRLESGRLVRDIFIDFVRRNSPLKARADGRIKDLSRQEKPA